MGFSLCHGQPLTGSLTEGNGHATIAATETNGLRAYTLASNAELRDNHPPDHHVTFAEIPDHARLRTGNVMFDGLYALAISEARQNSVSQIKDYAYGHNEPLTLEAFQTGETWTYVWTRDLSYSLWLGLAEFDPPRAINSLLFKTSTIKPTVTGGFTNQIIQDTGSGGSYPVSSDRIVWALGADATLQSLPSAQQKDFLAKIYPILHDTLEQDRQTVFDPADGLYRGEQSFLDWREQTYPGWTKDNVIAIAMSKSLSVNAANYFALQTASAYAKRLGLTGDSQCYAAWAAGLKSAINRNFFDPQTRFYSTYLLNDSGHSLRVHRYDLLGESLAILLGVADNATAKEIIARYPTGEFGPPVVWPQEQTVPIYHNQAIWPFVTAFWIKAARQAANPAAVDNGIHSLIRGAAFNLSNMENFDFVTGKAQVKDAPREGPVVDSRRQLWSVAGYLAMVQDVVFGRETTSDGIRFLPYVTSRLRNETFAGTDLIELQNFNYQGKLISVRIHLPPAGGYKSGACTIQKIEINGQTIGRDFVSATDLKNQNQWDLYLQNPPDDSAAVALNLAANADDGHSIFGPLPPEWEAIGQGGITSADGKLTLHFKSANSANTRFNIYRDGRLCAPVIRDITWTDPDSANFNHITHFYAVEAVDPATGNVSHLTPSHAYFTTNNCWTIPAAAMENHGGQLAENRYFMNWGKPDHEILVKRFNVRQDGKYFVRVEFSNGAGPVNTGITCAVKRLEIYRIGSDTPVAAGYLVMPQSGNWQRFDLSSVIPAHLQAGVDYSLRIFEDAYSRNMSYLAGNERYTACPGGGPDAYNYVNIASIQFQRTGN